MTQFKRSKESSLNALNREISLDALVSLPGNIFMLDEGNPKGRSKTTTTTSITQSYFRSSESIKPRCAKDLIKATFPAIQEAWKCNPDSEPDEPSDDK